jgi:hypothetical protein
MTISWQVLVTSLANKPILKVQRPYEGKWGREMAESMSQDYGEFFDRLSSSTSTLDERKKMMASYFGSSLRALIDRHVESMRNYMKPWTTELLTDEPPGLTIKAFYFGLFETDHGIQLYLSGSERDESDANWLCNPEYWPDGRYADIEALSTLEMTLKQKKFECWQYAQALTVTVLRDYLEHFGKDFDKLTGIPGARIITGFDDGDYFVIR